MRSAWIQIKPNDITALEMLERLDTDTAALVI